MTKLILPMTTLLLCTASCTNTDVSQTSEKIYHDYDEIEGKTILWNQLFEQEQNHYYSYIYSPRCGHCNEIKQEVIDYGLKHDDFYFILYSNDIPVDYEIETTIGKTDINDVFILGTPSLIEIKNSVVINNVAGSNSILMTLSKQK